MKEKQQGVRNMNENESTEFYRRYESLNNAYSICISLEHLIRSRELIYPIQQHISAKSLELVKDIMSKESDLFF